jgi:hypothetical protein
MAKAQGRDGATTAGLWLRKDCFGELGPNETERERAHLRVSRVADSEAELTVALDRARTQRWPQNRQQSTACGGGAPCTVWAERERGRESLVESAIEYGEVDEQGAGLKRGAGARTWPENAWTWVHPWRGDRGREVRDD